ncbi:MAG: PPC domain-containing protein [Verrucomicrobiota bacterium]
MTLPHCIRWLVLCISSALLWAQPIPKLNSISQEWIQRGTTIDVTFTGENLGAVARFIVSGDPGVTITNLPPGQPSLKVESSAGGISAIQPRDEKSIQARVTIAPDSSLSAREVRVATPQGVSNPLNLTVTHLPELIEDGSGKSLQNPFAIPLPAVITGRINGSAEVDHYKFSAKKGQHLVFEIAAARIGSPMDSSLAILKLDGQELARNEDAIGLDSMLDFQVPEDGEYVLQVRDFKYQGGGDYRYRLISGQTPFAKSVFPLGGQRGQNVELELKGPNLSASKVLLHVADQAPIGRQDIRANTPMGLSNPFPFEVSDLTNVREQEPNSAIDQADAVPVPVVINGRIQGEKDYDAFKFTVAKDQRLILEVVAHRYGSSLDALLTLTDARGNVLQRNDDAAGADARIEQKFAEAGEYVAIVEDLLERQGDNFAYRLTIRPPRPDFSVRYFPDTPRVFRGGHVPIRCELSRLTGFNETVRVTVEDLPSGFFSEALLLTPDGPANGTIVISATPEAPMGTFPLKLVAHTLLNGQKISRPATPLSGGDRGVKEGFLAVLEAAPFTLEPITLTSTVEQNQSTTIDVVVQRREGFQGEIKLAVEGFSAGRDPITKSFDLPAVTVKPEEARAKLTLKAKLDSEVGTRPIYLRGEASIDGQAVVGYSRLIPMTITPVPFVLTTTLKRVTVTALPPTSESAAREAIFAVRANRRAGFEGEIALTLDGVPEGVTASVEKIPQGSGEVSIKLVATDKAPVGKEFNLSLSGQGVFNDRNFKYQPEQIKLSVNAPEPVEETVKAASTN